MIELSYDMSKVIIDIVKYMKVSYILEKNLMLTPIIVGIAEPMLDLIMTEVIYSTCKQLSPLKISTKLFP
jgi:hypothetical protein